MKTAKEVLGELHDAFARKDFDAVLDMFADDCIIREAADLPFGGNWAGRDGVTALTTRQGELFEMAPTVQGMYAIDDSKVIMHTSMHVTSRATGEHETIPILEIYTVRDGKIIEALPFYHNAGALTQLASATT